MIWSVIAATIAIAAVAIAFHFVRQYRQRADSAEARAESVEKRFRHVVDADEELLRVRSEIGAAKTKSESDLSILARHLAQMSDEKQQLVQQRAVLEAQVSLLDEQANLQSFGFYTPKYNLADSSQYAGLLDDIREQQKALIKNKKAAVGSAEWTVNGSAAEGRRQINQTLKLMLRAFNGECDAAIARVRYNNVHVMEARIEKACELITSLAAVQQCEITPQYLALKLSELHLVHEYEERVQEEKEEQRRIREQMREEEIALREIERARLDAEKEERRYEDALQKARGEIEGAQGAKQAKLMEKISELEQLLSDAHERKERAISRAQLTRSGHVYVISNVGSFGEEVYKIGMTRRLDPQDRIKELGDASVPFPFDVHAILYSEDAPGLESRLHRAFGRHRVNLVNERKEFFAVSIDEICTLVRENHGDVMITKAAEAQEFRKTSAIRLERGEDRRSVQRSGPDRREVGD